MTLPRFLLLFILPLFLTPPCQGRRSNLLSSLKSPILLRGNDSIAYRDPAVAYHHGTFFLFYTVTKTTPDSIYSFVAQSQSNDLVHWTMPQPITPASQLMGFSSPGNVIRYRGQYVLCLQSYPRPNYLPGQGVRYGNDQARLFIIRSHDMKHWSQPELLRVKGDVPVSSMGRMIDPYLIQDKDEPGKWWCFYKQNGVSMSYSHDLTHWTPYGRTDCGENVSVLVDNGEYVLFHSPQNGIGVKRSTDLLHWRDDGPLIILGQQQWDWARGRITAATVIDLRSVRRIGCYLMFFHGSGPLTEPEGDFDRNASLGIAWSTDLQTWHYPM